MKVISPRRIAYRDALLLLITGLTAWVGREAWMDMYSRAITDSENGQALFAPLVLSISSGSEDHAFSSSDTARVCRDWRSSCLDTSHCNGV